jgi:dipeptidyl aminopeptidase/acylaminoacyl peptidase
MGVHNPDFINAVIGPKLMKAFPDQEPERFTAASPFDQVSLASQPWLILQGTRDSLTPVVETRAFVQVLKEKSAEQVVYAEFPAAQHAFDIYYCHRALAAVDLTARFLTTVRNQVQKPLSTDLPVIESE